MTSRNADDITAVANRSVACRGDSTTREMIRVPMT